MMIRPHDFDNNVRRIPVSKNPQKQRKPNADVASRRENYWDLNGRHQSDYDERLDLLPNEGVADTVSPVAAFGRRRRRRWQRCQWWQQFRRLLHRQ